MPCPGGCDVSYELFANLLKVHPFRSVDQVAGYTSGAKALNLGGEPILISLLTKTSVSGTVTTALDALPPRERYVASTQSHDLIFAAVVAGIILIAATNLANLVLVRALNQRRTFAIQSALGAGRGRIVRRMWAEHLVLVGIASGLGLLSNVAALQSGASRVSRPSLSTRGRIPARDRAERQPPGCCFLAGGGGVIGRSRNPSGPSDPSCRIDTLAM